VSGALNYTLLTSGGAITALGYGGDVVSSLESRRNAGSGARLYSNFVGEYEALANRALFAVVETSRSSGLRRFLHPQVLGGCYKMIAERCSCDAPVDGLACRGPRP
jgi:hypothetical protein